MVSFFVNVSPNHFSPRDCDKAQPDLGILVSCFGVSFYLQFSVGSPCSKKRESGNRAVVKTQESDSAAIRRPPESRISGPSSQDFFVVNPGGPAVVDRIRPIIGKLIFQPAFNIQEIKVMVACKGNVSSVRRKARIFLFLR